MGDGGKAGEMVLLSAAELEAMFDRSLRRAMNDAPALLDKQGLAQKLGCSSTQIDRLRKRGLPVVKVGEMVRFDLTQVLAWLAPKGAA